jgi:sirohydrochlorin ferrochelatase
VKTGIIIIDHGSRSSRSNDVLEHVALRFARRYGHRFDIVEPAHMELAEPTLRQAYARCVQRGADEIVVCPFFLSPGKHMSTDIPRLADAAAREFAGTSYRVAPPLGADDLILDLLAKRADEALSPEAPSFGKDVEHDAPI